MGRMWPWRRRTIAVEPSTPLASYHPWQERENELRNFTSFLEDAERRCCDRVREEWQRRRGMADRPRRWDDGASPSNAPSGAKRCRQELQGRCPLLD
jgi:hypothetical protein